MSRYDCRNSNATATTPCDRCPSPQTCGEANTIAGLMDAQAELQTAIGFFRLREAPDPPAVLTASLIEERLIDTLDQLHGLLAGLGVEMAPRRNPAIDPRDQLRGGRP